MRKVVWTVAAGLGLAVGVCFAEIDLTYDVMQPIEDTNKSLSSNIALKDAAAATRNATELLQAFETVEKYFQAKGDAPDAVELAVKSKTLSEAIIKAVAAKDFDAATSASTELSRTCRACHTFYKKD